MRRLAATISAVLAIGFADQSALADKRVAFVVGNSNYQNVVTLTNPPANAYSHAMMRQLDAMRSFAMTWNRAAK